MARRRRGSAGPRATIEIDDDRLVRSIKDTTEALKSRRKANAAVARAARDYVRKTITLQGRKRKYKPLSSLTKEKTGRRKALITLRKLIKAKWSNDAAQVYFAQKDPRWHIDDHHLGFSSRAVRGKKMIIRSHKGNIIAFFTKRKQSKIPAREVWPDENEMRRLAAPIYLDWVTEATRKGWR